MGGTETEKPVKEPKTPPPPNAQAYSPMAPPSFLASSPQAHPYMWGVQPIMPPYGTQPHPYVAMYPHGGLYPHPSISPGSYPFSPFNILPANGMAEASGTTLGGADADSKPHVGKEKLPIKRSKGSLGNLNMITGKSNEEGKTIGPSANDACSKSAESASDGTSDGSDADSQYDSPMKSGERQVASEVDGHQNGSSAHVSQDGVPNVSQTMMNHSLPMMPLTMPGALSPARGPATNLNIGMDYWSAAASSAIPAVQGKVPVGSGMVTDGPQDNLQSQLWLQDERELKRQRRKLSNRESARRSRLRKQAECDELAQRADYLKDENSNLRSELNRIRSKYEQLMAENLSLKVRLGETREDLESGKIERGTLETGKTNKVHSSLLSE